MVDIEEVKVKTPKAGPYSQAIKAGNFIFISGQVPSQDAKSIKEQTLSALKKIKDILEAAGSKVSKLVKVSVFLKNIDDFKEMNEMYKDFFNQNGVMDKYPARTTVEATSPLKEFLIEIDAIALA
jgi:2-iminobutanoate/2-iminopropanoate deaminase